MRVAWELCCLGLCVQSWDPQLNVWQTREGSSIGLPGCCAVQGTCNSQGAVGSGGVQGLPWKPLQIPNSWRAIPSMKSSVTDLVVTPGRTRAGCPMLWLGSCWLGIRIYLSSRMNGIVGEAGDLPHLEVFKIQLMEPWPEPCIEWEGGGDDLQMSLLAHGLWCCEWWSDLCLGLWSLRGCGNAVFLSKIWC